MIRQQKTFSFAPLVMLFLPYAALMYFCKGSDVLLGGMIGAGAITGICLLTFVARNWRELLAGLLSSVMIIAILSVCALIPVVGWIADVLIVLYAFVSIWASIGALTPYALKAVAIWSVFIISLLPPVFDPVFSPLVVFAFSLALGAALAKKGRPLDEFLLIMTSIPLLAMAIASLGKLLQSGLVLRNAQFQQNVSGYTTRAGVQVDSYTRMITKTVPVTVTSFNPGAAVVGAVAGQQAQADKDA